MNNILSLIKKWWKPILIIIILSIAFIVLGIKSCKEKKQEVRAEAAKFLLYKANVIDSVNTANYNRKLSELDSLKKVEAIKTATFRKSAEKHYTEAIKLRSENNILQQRLDSLEEAKAECPELLAASKTVNKGLYKELNEQDKVIDDLGSEAEGYSRQLFICERQSLIKDSVILSKEVKIRVLETQTNNLICYRDWAFKHPFWKWVFGWKCGK